MVVISGGLTLQSAKIIIVSQYEVGTLAVDGWAVRYLVQPAQAPPRY